MESLQSVTRLIFEGINYRAAVWVNGHLLASPVGTFRTFPIDISAAARAGDNAVAVQITRPFDRALPSTNHDTDLAISFVDWSPAPPDGNMGLWMPVLLDQQSSLSLSTPYLTVSPISSTPPAPASPCDVSITIIVYATNSAASPAFAADLSCTLALSDGRHLVVSQQISLQPLQTLRLQFAPGDFPQLRVAGAALWWPWQMGAATLNTLTCSLQDQRLLANGDARHTAHFQPPTPHPHHLQALPTPRLRPSVCDGSTPRWTVTAAACTPSMATKYSSEAPVGRRTCFSVRHALVNA